MSFEKTAEKEISRDITRNILIAIALTIVGFAALGGMIWYQEYKTQLVQESLLKPLKMTKQELAQAQESLRKEDQGKPHR